MNNNEIAIQEESKSSTVNFYEQLPKIDKYTAEFVNYIFQRLSAIVGNMRYKAECATTIDAIKREYTYAIMSSGIKNSTIINKALERIRDEGILYCPTPSQFIAYCKARPGDIGAPDIETAYSEACLQSNPATWKSIWSHDAVKEAYKRTGHSQFLNGKAESTFNKFSQHYLNACNDCALGRIAPQIEHKRPFSVSDIDAPYTWGKYEFVRPGVLKQYEHVKTAEEAFAIIDVLLGKGDSRLKKLINKIEKEHLKENWI